MGVVHYKKGTVKDPEINGLHCEIKVVSPYSFVPEQGWHMSPEEAHGIQKKEVEEEPTMEVRSEKENNDEKGPEKEVLERRRESFNCAFCNKLRRQYPDEMITTEDLKFCDDKCLNDYLESNTAP